MSHVNIQVRLLGRNSSAMWGCLWWCVSVYLCKPVTMTELERDGSGRTCSLCLDKKTHLKPSHSYTPFYSLSFCLQQNFTSNLLTRGGDFKMTAQAPSLFSPHLLVFHLYNPVTLLSSILKIVFQFLGVCLCVSKLLTLICCLSICLISKTEAGWVETDCRSLYFFSSFPFI